MHKLFTLSFLLTGMCLTGQLSIPKWDWTYSIKSPQFDEMFAVVTDDDGNVYTAGRFLGTVDFDPDTAVTVNLTSLGNYDIFISKLDSNGAFLWVRHLGGTGPGAPSGMALDHSGNLVVVGHFGGTMDFDPGPGVLNLTGVNNDAFTWKLDKDGDLIWATNIGGPGSELAYSLCIDSENNIITTGSYYGAADFDPGSGVFTVSAASGFYNNMYITKVDSNGQFQWVKPIGNTELEIAHSCSIDPWNNILVTGLYEDTVDFDTGPGITNLTSPNNYSAFILKLNPSGLTSWVRSIGGGFDDIGYSITTDNEGNVYTTGEFTDTTDFDPGPGTYFLAPGGYAHLSDIFISKLDNAGQFTWAISFKSLGYYNDLGRGITLDDQKNIYATGTFGSTVDFDPGPDTLKLIAASAIFNSFVCKLDSNAQMKWAVVLASDDYIRSNAVALDNRNNLYTVGAFDGTVDFDPRRGVHNISAYGNTSAYLNKLTTCIATLDTITDTACHSYLSPSGYYSYTRTGTYRDTISSPLGCDSLITMHLTIYEEDSVNENISACRSYYWNANGQIYTASALDTAFLINSDGCDSVITLNLNVTNIDTAIIRSHNTLSASQSGASYQWFYCDSIFSPIPNEISQSFQPATDSGYAVVISLNGCTDTSECFSFKNIGIDEFSLTGLLSLHPNPTQGNVILSSSQLLSQVQLVLYNSSLQLVKEMEYSNTSEISFTLDGPQGIYLLQVKNNKSKHAMLKLVKLD